MRSRRPSDLRGAALDEPAQSAARVRLPETPWRWPRARAPAELGGMARRLHVDEEVDVALASGRTAIRAVVAAWTKPAFRHRPAAPPGSGLREPRRILKPSWPSGLSCVGGGWRVIESSAPVLQGESRASSSAARTRQIGWLRGGRRPYLQRLTDKPRKKKSADGRGPIPPACWILGSGPGGLYLPPSMRPAPASLRSSSRASAGGQLTITTDVENYPGSRTSSRARG
jgi:hypothetical protein